ncbi:histidine-containing phosphotransfer protein 1 [Lolium perenne]|uniref:histidine-containing phosphotransfer protein 1 n=1 Tax=Lolium perenne TaxID=4522 RepID=UPI0021F5DAAB|nr:histidine-containing phosphotransfer protein 1-like [Lolium perenne]XP_051202594.1 histidine-containing phosphotransfer protein 1-like [Lolium perenne]XP_051202595.1 histidine-containing phosphotransfer protein 1-like [Lolium perenne]
MAATMKLSTLGYAASMLSTGLFDEQFQKFLLLQKSDPNFVTESITMFCEDGEQTIGELTKQLGKQCVNFDEVAAFVHKLEGSSASVGAQRVKNTCIQFLKFCKEKNRDGCLKTLDTLRVVFYEVSNMFQVMLQMEQQQAEATK